ncbi:proteasome accessory factor PafA2 [Corynebacterium sp. CCUG 61414]|uniref:depupylase/deamidase Dop n=1 Tax=Corynebacterium sp. CCUG 61414 TaxID=2823896 RepID=UPI00210BDC99|nr:depupylase/deamidase Dop [Corynebacterium sp. CCUG 61414]MCQ4609203.1 proteasome accessory factor PafA2 [Corynebacterium sp. CCUG 61414]
MGRFMGTETEYGITTPSDPTLSPLITSTHAVVAYAAMHTSARSRWDYAEEHPLKDARGYDLQRYRTVPVVDPNAIGVANVVTTNGARYYVDHGHPEYSSPEVDNAWDAMLYDAAGDLYLRQSMDDIRDLWDEGISVLDGASPCPPIKFYKNNVDGKGQSYGSHENYQYSRHTDFAAVVEGLIPFFVTRQVIVGAGRVGIGRESEHAGFQISQRADYFEQEISLETTLNRGIINTRDEPHADATQFRRLHVIIGDANMSQYSNFLKMGMTKLVLDAIEAGVDFSDLTIQDPVAELQRISHDPTCTHKLLLANGRRCTAIEVLREIRDRVQGLPNEGDVDKRVLALWAEVLDDLAVDPLRTADRLDWTAKWALVRSFMDRGVAADDPKLKMIDIQYADIDPAKSLYHALVRKGSIRTLVGDEEIAHAAKNPPRNSRAYFRGKVTEKFGEEIAASSWQSIVFRIEDRMVRVPLDDVNGWTYEQTAQIINRATTASELLNALGYKHV